MGQAINRLNNLRAQRALLLKNQERIEKLYPVQRDDYSVILDKKHKEIFFSILDRDIEALEKQAEEEQEKETIETVLKDIQNEATEVGKVLASALQKGLNGK